MAPRDFNDDPLLEDNRYGPYAPYDDVFGPNGEFDVEGPSIEEVLAAHST